MTRNSPDEIKLRRNQNTLVIVGTGTIAFGVWSFVKTITVLFFRRSLLLESFYNYVQNPETLNDISEKTIFTVMVIVFSLILALDLAARLIVGFSAISEGKGVRRGRLYIVITCIMILSSIRTIQFFLTEWGTEYGITGERVSVSLLIIELTSAIMLIQMLASAIRVRRLTGRSGHHEE